MTIAALAANKAHRDVGKDQLTWLTRNPVLIELPLQSLIKYMA
jgi:hypothetical protein